MENTNFNQSVKGLITMPNNDAIVLSDEDNRLKSLREHIEYMKDQPSDKPKVIGIIGSKEQYEATLAQHLTELHEHNIILVHADNPEVELITTPNVEVEIIQELDNLLANDNNNVHLLTNPYQYINTIPRVP